MTKAFVAAISSCFMLVGCMSSVRVYRSNSLTEQPRGIPFYVKTGVCKQETTWLEPQYILTYESKAGAASRGPLEKVLNRSEFLNQEVQTFIADPSNTALLRRIFDDPRAYPGPNSINESDPASITGQEMLGNWMRVSNTGAVEAVVDYADVFYLNSARPLAGTTQVDAKLAADGTLTEGSAQLNDQTLATIASTISSLVSSATTAAKFVGLDAQVEIKITVKTRVYKHTHSQYPSLGKSATPATCPALAGGVFGGSFAVTEVADSAGAKPTAGDNTIGISGSIVLPKSATPTSPAPAPTGTPTPPKK